MGCDIHYVIEKKFDDKWVGVYAGYESPTPLSEVQDTKPGDWSSMYARKPRFGHRDYTFFNLLAGVRGSGPAVPLGIPEDCSHLAQHMIDEEGSGGHSHSFLPYKEWCERYALASAMVFTDAGSHAWLSGVDDEDIDQYRVVFWFDN